MICVGPIAKIFMMRREVIEQDRLATLGRRLCSYVLPELAWDKARVLSYVKQQDQLPTGAKIIRFRSDKEVHTWRLAP